NGDAGPFHVDQDRYQWQLDVEQQGCLRPFLQRVAERLDAPERAFDVRAGVWRGEVDRHRVHGRLVAAGADQLRDFRLLDAEAIEGEVLEPDRGLAEQVGGDHRVEGDG